MSELDTIEEASLEDEVCYECGDMVSDCMCNIFDDAEYPDTPLMDDDEMSQDTDYEHE